MSNSNKVWGFVLLLALALGATYLVGRTVRFGGNPDVMSQKAVVDAEKSVKAAEVAVTSAKNAADLTNAPVLATPK